MTARSLTGGALLAIVITTGDTVSSSRNLVEFAHGRAA